MKSLSTVTKRLLTDIDLTEKGKELMAMRFEGTQDPLTRSFVGERKTLQDKIDTLKRAEVKNRFRTSLTSKFSMMSKM